MYVALFYWVLPNNKGIPFFNGMTKFEIEGITFCVVLLIIAEYQGDSVFQRNDQVWSDKHYITQMLF